MSGKSTRRQFKYVLAVGSAIIGAGLLVSVLGVVAFGGGPGLWLNSKDFARSLNEKLIVQPIARWRIERGLARGRREAKGDLARGDLRIKVVGSQPPWFAAYRRTAINTYGVGIDQLGCMIDDEGLAYARGYNEESMKVISVKVGEEKLDAAEKAAEAEWNENTHGPAKPSAQLGGTTPNYAVNASVLASRRLRSKRRASRPARYRER